MTDLKHLEPQIVWKYFQEILNIPRPSRYLEKISEYIINFAKEHNLEYTVDNAGNILIKKSATSENLANKKTIILQSHLDMVPEKENGIQHNFTTDPIKSEIIDSWVTAKGTTLGADNGIGIAGALAVLASSNIVHGPIEALFTVDEEIGLIGATKIDPELLTKEAILLNLDSEDDGQIFISSAGGFDAEMNFKTIEDETNQTEFLKIVLTGMKGGHSGCDIHLNNGNALLTLIEFIEFLEKDIDVDLVSIEGGKASNAIPRSAEAVVSLSDEKFLEDKINVFIQEIKRFCDCPELKISTEKISVQNATIITNKSRFFIFLKQIPKGVLEMSQEMENLVETSANLASVSKENDFFKVVYSGRSASAEKQEELKIKLQEVCKFHDVGFDLTDEYFGWAPDLNSEILKISQKVYLDLFEKKPEIMAIHAGLECGILKHIYPKLDVISFGPTIKFPHSPDEKLEIKTVERFWKLLKGILEY